MERTLIAWNAPNWITVLTMGLAGYALLVVVSNFLGARSGGGAVAGGGGF